MSSLTPLPQHPGTEAGIVLLLKRDDLLAPPSLERNDSLTRWIQGNKWRKLQPVLENIRQAGRAGILTFGGAFSNHLHAVAAAGQHFGLKTAAVVRGTTADPNNPTLRFAQACGMALHPVPKSEYDKGIASPLVAAIIADYREFYLLPEGGATREGVISCQNIAREILDALPLEKRGYPLFIAVPAGTGTTAAGVISGLGGTGKTIIFPAAPYGVDESTIMARLAGLSIGKKTSFYVIQDYIFGSFVSNRTELTTFAAQFYDQTGIHLDPIYTVKMLYGVYDLLRKGYFPPKSTVVALHTGGLQGWDGFRQRFGGI